MYKKIIFVVLFLLLLFIPSFCSAFHVESVSPRINKNLPTLPWDESQVTDYFFVQLDNSGWYSLFLLFNSDYHFAFKCTNSNNTDYWVSACDSSGNEVRGIYKVTGMLSNNYYDYTTNDIGYTFFAFAQNRLSYVTCSSDILNYQGNLWKSANSVGFTRPINYTIPDTTFISPDITTDTIPVKMYVGEFTSDDINYFSGSYCYSANATIEELSNSTWLDCDFVPYMNGPDLFYCFRGYASYNGTYFFKILDNRDSSREYYFTFTITNINTSDNALLISEQQTQDLLREQQQTNVGIFEGIGQILSFINPFSENFFVYKLVDLLIEGLRGLFVPSDTYFSNKFNELNTFFSDRFGILYAPFYLMEQFVEGLHTALVTQQEPIIHIPDVQVFDTTLIHGFDYNFNSLLENNTFRIIHDIYLLAVDVILTVLVLRLAKRTFDSL